MLNILIAYPYWFKDMPETFKSIDECGQLRLLIDSGAFTAWKSGNPIKLDDYCRFIETLPIKPWRYFALDVIGDPHGTMQNYETMLKRGFTPVPIFTRGEDPSVLETYYQTSDLVGIGGLVGTQQNKGFVKGLSKFIKGRRVHLLGFTNKTFVKVLRPYSCDSSSVNSSLRFAHIDIFDRRLGTWVKVNKNTFKTKPNGDLLRLLQSYDVDVRKLGLTVNWSGVPCEAMHLNYRSHLRASLLYEGMLDVRYFLAVSTTQQVSWLVKHHDKELFLYDRMHKTDPVLRGASGSQSRIEMR